MNEHFTEMQTDLFGTDGFEESGRAISETLNDTTTGEKVTLIRDFDEAGELISFDAYDSMGRKLGNLPERVARRAAEYLADRPDMELCGEVVLVSGGENPSCTLRIWVQAVSNVTYTAPMSDYSDMKKGSSPLVFLISIIIIVFLVAAVGISFLTGALSLFGDVSEALPEMPDMPSLSLGNDNDDDYSSLFEDESSSSDGSQETVSKEEEEEDEPAVTAEELEVTLTTEEDDRLGVTYVRAKVKNNSDYALTSLTLYVNYGGESLVLISTDTTLSGETTGNMESFVMKTAVGDIPTPAKFSLTAKVGEDKAYIKYDYKLKEYQTY